MDSPVVPVAIGLLSAMVAMSDLLVQAVIAFVCAYVAFVAGIAALETDLQLDMFVAREVVAVISDLVLDICAGEVVVAGIPDAVEGLIALVSVLLAGLKAFSLLEARINRFRRGEGEAKGGDGDEKR
jgi:hypothetical protein